MNGACIAQMLKVMELLKNTHYSQQELLDSLRLFFCYVNHRWCTWCEVTRYIANMQAPIFCYQLEADMRLHITVDSIQEEAQKNGRVANQIASWVRINEQALCQRYAQELEEKCSYGAVIFAKGDLIMLI